MFVGRIIQFLTVFFHIKRSKLLILYLKNSFKRKLNHHFKNTKQSMQLFSWSQINISIQTVSWYLAVISTGFSVFVLLQNLNWFLRTPTATLEVPLGAMCIATLVLSSLQASVLVTSEEFKYQEEKAEQVEGRRSENGPASSWILLVGNKEMPKIDHVPVSLITVYFCVSFEARKINRSVF